MSKNNIIEDWNIIAQSLLNRESISSERTRETYRRIIREWFEIVANPDGRVIHPADIVAEHVAELVSRPVRRKLSKNRSVRQGQAAELIAPSPSYRQMRLSVLVGLLDEAIMLNKCERNWAREYQRTHRPRQRRHKPREYALSQKEWERFIEQVRASSNDPHIVTRNVAIFYLLAYSGLRVHELVGIRMSDIDWDAMEIRVIGKGGKNMPVIITRQAAEPLRQWIRESRPALFAGKESDHLWVSKRGTPLSKDMVQLLARQCMERAGIAKESLGPHDLRHTFVTWALDSGASIHEVATAARHANIETTRLYDDSEERKRRDRVRKVFEE